MDAATQLRHWAHARSPALRRFHTALFLPAEGCTRGHLGAVVTDHHAGRTAHIADPVQLTGNTDAGERVVDDERQAFPSEVIDHGQDAEPSAVGERGYKWTGGRVQ